MIHWTLSDQGDLAYIYLTDKIEKGSAATTVDLSDLAQVEGVEALQSILLDFDADGRLLGIEILDAAGVLPRDLLRERGHDESRHHVHLDELPRKRPSDPPKT